MPASVRVCVSPTWPGVYVCLRVGECLTGSSHTSPGNQRDLLEGFELQSNQEAGLVGQVQLPARISETRVKKWSSGDHTHTHTNT